MIAAEQPSGYEEKDEKDPYSDYAKVSQDLDDDLKVDSYSRYLFLSDWFRNVLFLVGAQWIKKVGGRWQQRNLPMWFPRAQTNKFAEKVKDLVGQLVTGQRIPITILPASGDEADIGTAKVADRVREVYYTEACVDDKEETIATWLVVTGNAFAIPHYDMDPKHGTSFVQFQECAQCETTFKPEDLADEDEEHPVCPECGGELTPAKGAGESEDEESDIGDDYPRGAIQLDACGPLEISGDHRVPNVSDWTWFVRRRRYDVADAKEKWPKYKEFITADNGGDDTGQYYLDVISNITSSFSVGSGMITSGGASSKNPKCTAYEYYKLPNKTYPQGLKAVRIGTAAEAIVECGPLKTVYGAGVKKGQSWLPLIHFGYEIVPGRFWRKTPMDDVIPLQLERNTVQANIRLSVQRMGNAIWLLPKGCGVDGLTGEPGQTVSYNPIAVGGTTPVKPERLAAELNNLTALTADLQRIDNDIEHVSGATLQGGQTPPGVTAASALAYLGEKEQQSLSTLRSSYAKSWRMFDEYALELARQNWDEERLRTIAGKNGKWDVEKFTKADLQGSVNLLIDYNGIAPKSSATEQAKVAQLTQMGMINPQDEGTRIEVMKMFGTMKLLGPLNTDIEYAAKLQDKFMDDGEMPKIRPGVDNSALLLREAIEFAKTDEYMEMSEDKQAVWDKYCELRMYDIAQRRVALTAAGLDPDVPALAEIPTALAEAGLVSAAQEQAKLQAEAQAQSGGIPSGQQAPDARLSPTGSPLPGSGLPGAPPSPDIADNSGTMNITGQEGPGVKPPGSPRTIPLPPNA